MGFCEFDQLDFEGTLIKYILFFFFSEQADKSNFSESIFILETFIIIILRCNMKFL